MKLSHPYDRFYSSLTEANVWINENILGFLTHEHQKILDFTDAKKSHKVLDYGCNTGYIAEKIKRKYKCKVVGVDINRYAITVAQERGIEAKLITPSFIKKHQSHFDAIILSHVLEHVEKPIDLLEKVYSLLKVKGTFVIAIPQERIRGDITPLQIIYFLLKLRFDNPHKYKFSKNQLFSLLKKTGFTPKKNIFINFLPPFVSEKRNFWKVRTLIVKCTKT